MSKVILTKEQALRMEYLKSDFTTNESIGMKFYGFQNKYNLCLNDLTLEDFTIALVIGYEIETPPAPKLEIKKIHVSFNHGGNEHEIYIGLHSSNGKFQYCQDFSLQEAKDIADTLYSLIEYHNKYSNQKDKQNDNTEESWGE